MERLKYTGLAITAAAGLVAGVFQSEANAQGNTAFNTYTEDGRYFQPNNNPRPAATESRPQAARTAPATATPAYISGQAATCPTTPEGVNSLLRVGDSSDDRVLVWIRPLGSLKWVLNYLFGPSFNRVVPRGLIINGQFEGSTVTITSNSEVNCLLEGNPHTGRLGN